MAESKVTGIIKSLNSLEDDIDSLKDKIADMKKQLSVKAQSEIDILMSKAGRVGWKSCNQISATLGQILPA